MKIVVFDKQIEARQNQLKKQMLKDGLLQEMKQARTLREAVGHPEVPRARTQLVLAPRWART